MAKIKNSSKVYIQHWASGCTGSPCVSDFISSVPEILHHDYPHDSFKEFNDVYAWDADSYEHRKYGSNSSETVDMVFALDYGKMLMVEAKLKVQHVDNIKGEVEAKIKHTREYLVSSTNFKKVQEPSIVLFGQRNFQVLSNRYRRLRNYKTDIIPMTVSGFYKKYFGTTDCLSQP